MQSRPTSRFAHYAPGLLLTICIALIGDVLADRLGKLILSMQGIDHSASSPISGILVAILIGLIIRNVLGLAPWFDGGVQLSMKTILRAGIVLLGLRLSIYDLAIIGTWGIPIVSLTVAAGIVFTLWITRRLAQPDRLGMLIAASTSICGVTAVVATAPAIGAEEREITYAIGTVTVFGMAAMVLYPYFAHWALQGNPVLAGIFLGTAIHETAQVAGAALIYSQAFGQALALDVATVTKLVRNVFLVFVVPVLGFAFASRAAGAAGNETGTRPGLLKLFPTFVLGFLAMAIVRSIGDAGVEAGGAAFGILNDAAWQQSHQGLVKFASKYLLGAAMAGVGLNSSLHVIRRLGFGPIVVGFLSALAVGAVGLLAAIMFGGLVQSGL